MTRAPILLLLGGGAIAVALVVHHWSATAAPPRAGGVYDMTNPTLLRHVKEALGISTTYAPPGVTPTVLLSRERIESPVWGEPESRAWRTYMLGRAAMLAGPTIAPADTEALLGRLGTENRTIDAHDIPTPLGLVGLGLSATAIAEGKYPGEGADYARRFWPSLADAGRAVGVIPPRFG